MANFKTDASPQSLSDRHALQTIAVAPYISIFSTSESVSEAPRFLASKVNNLSPVN